tara:strand:- start:85315 stop:86499 length:1185 start_codon:yes stop_codon:yes gene_type:complete
VEDSFTSGDSESKRYRKFIHWNSRGQRNVTSNHSQSQPGKILVEIKEKLMARYVKGRLKLIILILGIMLPSIANCTEERGLRPQKLEYYLDETLKYNSQIETIAAATGPIAPGAPYRLSLFNRMGQPILTTETTRATPLRLSWDIEENRIYYLDEEDYLLVFEYDPVSQEISRQSSRKLPEGLPVYSLFSYQQDVYLVRAASRKPFPARDPYNVYVVESGVFGGIRLRPVLSVDINDSGPIQRVLPLNQERSEWALGSMNCVDFLDLRKQTVERIYCRAEDEPLIYDFAVADGKVYLLQSNKTLSTLPLRPQSIPEPLIEDLPYLPSRLELSPDGFFWLSKENKSVHHTSMNGKTVTLLDKSDSNPNDIVSDGERLLVLDFAAKVTVLRYESGE